MFQRLAEDRRGNEGLAAEKDLGEREGGEDLCAAREDELTFVDTHGVMFAEPRPKYGVYAPIICPKSGVAALARDHESSKQVWSAIEG